MLYVDDAVAIAPVAAAATFVRLEPAVTVTPTATAGLRSDPKQPTLTPTGAPAAPAPPAPRCPPRLRSPSSARA